MRRGKKEHRYWGDVKNQKDFLQSIGINQNNCTQFTCAHIISKGGSGLLCKYNGSAKRAMRAIFQINEDTNNSINEGKNKFPRGYWTMGNQKKFLDNCFKDFNLKSFEDWYNIPLEKIREKGGGRLLNIYGNIFNMLKENYPEYSWDILKYNTKSKYQYIKTPEFLLSLQKKYQIQRKEDWERISLLQLRKEKATSLDTRGGLFKLLKQIHPHEIWTSSFFRKKLKKSEQRWLLINLQSIFKEHYLIEDYHPMINFKSRVPIELDIYIPALNLAFEYNGQQHYDEILGGFSPIEVNKSRDQEKQSLCLSHNIHLIDIPYWWDQNSTSLSILISQYFGRNNINN